MGVRRSSDGGGMVLGGGCAYGMCVDMPSGGGQAIDSGVHERASDISRGDSNLHDAERGKKKMSVSLARNAHDGDKES